MKKLIINLLCLLSLPVRKEIAKALYRSEPGIDVVETNANSSPQACAKAALIILRDLLPLAQKQAVLMIVKSVYGERHHISRNPVRKAAA